MKDLEQTQRQWGSKPSSQPLSLCQDQQIAHSITHTLEFTIQEKRRKISSTYEVIMARPFLSSCSLLSKFSVVFFIILLSLLSKFSFRWLCWCWVVFSHSVNMEPQFEIWFLPMGNTSDTFSRFKIYQDTYHKRCYRNVEKSDTYNERRSRGVEGDKTPYF